ncbi:hypothetical protein AOLI_G00142230 [Acnodon oligacanthus]
MYKRNVAMWSAGIRSRRPRVREEKRKRIRSSSETAVVIDAWLLQPYGPSCVPLPGLALNSELLAGGQKVMGQSEWLRSA